MSPKPRPVPEGYATVTPYLITESAARAIEFYVKAFGAMELMRFVDAGGKIGHAEVRIGDSRVMLADEFPDHGARSPKSLGGTPVFIHLYVEDVDALAARAAAAGAKVVRPVENQFYGDRSTTLEDPFGHVWNVATHVEDVSEEELKRRSAALGH
jgi:PhnB protein